MGNNGRLNKNQIILPWYRLWQLKNSPSAVNISRSCKWTHIWCYIVSNECSMLWLIESFLSREYPLPPGCNRFALIEHKDRSYPSWTILYYCYLRDHCSPSLGAVIFCHFEDQFIIDYKRIVFSRRIHQIGRQDWANATQAGILGAFLGMGINSTDFRFSNVYKYKFSFRYPHFTLSFLSWNLDRQLIFREMSGNVHSAFFHT